MRGAPAASRRPARKGARGVVIARRRLPGAFERANVTLDSRPTKRVTLARLTRATVTFDLVLRTSVTLARLTRASVTFDPGPGMRVTLARMKTPPTRPPAREPRRRPQLLLHDRTPTNPDQRNLPDKVLSPG